MAKLARKNKEMESRTMLNSASKRGIKRTRGYDWLQLRLYTLHAQGKWFWTPN
jgi:hypothetical protein